MSKCRVERSFAINTLYYFQVFFLHFNLIYIQHVLQYIFISKRHGHSGLLPAGSVNSKSWSGERN